MSTTKIKQPLEGSPEKLIDAEAERLIIANILTQPGFFRRVGPQLNDSDFAIEQHRRVFELARQIHEAGADPTLSEVYRLIIDAGKTTEELGLPMLSSLAYDNMIEIASPERWIRSLKAKSAERRLWRAAERLRLGVESGAALAELSAARDELRSIEGSFETTEPVITTIANTVEAIGVDNLLATPQGVIAWPSEVLTSVTNGGLKRGELCLLASRPSVGKSTLALQTALAASAAGLPSLVISLEMPQQDLLKRALCAEGNIPHGLIVQGDLDRAWRFRVMETLDRIGGYPLEITDKLRTLQSIVGKVAATPNLALLVVDYLGLVDPGAWFENRNQEVSAISRRLKLLALDYDIPVLALHQLNRANESENRRPQLSDLRDSGSLEQDADCVLLLDAPAARKRNNDGDKDLIDVIIAKQRNGVRGHVVPLRLEGKFCRMVQQDSTDTLAQAERRSR